MKRLLWWLIAGSKGGPSRARIIRFLGQRPSNANQISSALGMEYKNVRHHLKVMEENGLVTNLNQGAYGSLYFVSSRLETEMETFEEICGHMAN
jgi:DNA-binding transcriptional ArsR family regulator